MATVPFCPLALGVSHFCVTVGTNYPHRLSYLSFETIQIHRSQRFTFVCVCVCVVVLFPSVNVSCRVSLRVPFALISNGNLLHHYYENQCFLMKGFSSVDCFWFLPPAALTWIMWFFFFFFFLLLVSPSFSALTACTASQDLICPLSVPPPPPSSLPPAHKAWMPCCFQCPFVDYAPRNHVAQLNYQRSQRLHFLLFNPPMASKASMMPTHKETLLQWVALVAPEAAAPNFSFFCPDVLPRQQNPIRAFERPLRAAEDMWYGYYSFYGSTFQFHTFNDEP